MSNTGEFGNPAVESLHLFQSPTRVVSIETFFLPPRWLIVRVETADGFIGWGECGVVSWPQAAKAAIDEVAETIIKSDHGGPRDIWDIGTKGRAYMGGAVLAGAVSAIDQALWDIAGKRTELPVHQLLGGKVRDRVKAYSWITLDEHGREAIPTAEFAELAAQRVSEGMTAVKIGKPRRGYSAPAYEPIETLARANEIVDHVAAVRAAIGPNVDLGIDLHGQCSVPMAKRLLPMLEPYELMFAEEPTAAPHIDGIREVANHTRIPLATGERFHSLTEFKALLDAGIGVLQPDLNNMGGITEGRRIADVARAYDVTIAPHCSAGPIGLAAALQFAFATHNFLVQEQGTDYYSNREIFPQDYFHYIVEPKPLIPAAGFFELNARPGLGIEIDEGNLRELSTTANTWAPPVLRRKDRSFAQW